MNRKVDVTDIIMMLFLFMCLYVKMLYSDKMLGNVSTSEN